MGNASDRGDINVGRRLVHGLQVDPGNWLHPEAGALETDGLQAFLSRKRAVELYLSGAPASAVEEVGGLGIKQVARLVRERCLAVHPDGLPYGWRGLVRYEHINQYYRKKRVRSDKFGYGTAGAFGTVLSLHPELKKAFEKRIYATAPDSKLGSVNSSRTKHWSWFLDQLRDLGYETRNEWPFDTVNRGYVTICAFIKATMEANPHAAAKVIGGKSLQTKLKAGDGVDRPQSYFMRRVEMDAHKLDGIFCVLFPTDEGGWVPKVIHRIWVVVLLETMSRAVLGYHLSFGKEVSKDDVLRAIKKSLLPSFQRLVTFSDVAYKPGAGLPSGIDEKFIGLCWDETSVDGALAETCASVEKQLNQVVNSTLLHPDNSFSQRRSKDDRPFIESFFGKLAALGFQQMTNTTGANPTGKHGRKPDEVAINSKFQVEYAQELLDVIIANYNATPHTTIFRSPLEHFRFLFERDENHRPRKADSTLIQQLMSVGKFCKVCGGLAQGRRPYVNFFGATYTNDLLGGGYHLVGKKIWVSSHLEDDNRVAQAATVEGHSLGILRAGPPWHLMPHSLAVRRAIKAQLRLRRFRVAEGKDATQAFLEFVDLNHGVLPVHSTYLEMRRILSELNSQDLATDLLAKAKLELEVDQAESGSTAARYQASKERGEGVSKPPLPAPRRTATR